MKILVVDDNPDFVFAVRELLERAGHEVEVATDGSEALLAAGQGQPRVVILDFKMPGFNGAITGPMLRKFAPGASIVGVSGFEDLDTGWADVFLAKDDVLDRLIDTVATFDTGDGDPA